MEFNEQNELMIDVKQTAVLVGMDRGVRGEIDIQESMQELAELAYAAGAQVAVSMIQNKSTIEAATYIGKGKVEEVRQAVVAQGANLVIFNDELSGAQIRNLEAAIQVRIIDRTALILDIFALRAQSKIAKLQVELAQLKYRLPRLTGLGSEMSRTGGGIGTRGPGEQKLELDRRRINDKITDIRRRLKEATENREVTRQQRVKSELPIVALVGYTNAGKSSIMNKFISTYHKDSVDKHVFEKDMLFATLDTYHRKIDLDDHKSFILIDTVGFVSKLPHALVEAFKATLEEVVHADLVVHVVDASNEHYELQIGVTDKTLKEIGLREHEEVCVFNKADLVTDRQNHERASVWTSMLTGEGFDSLVKVIDDQIFTSHKRVKMLIPFTEGSVLNKIVSQAKVYETTYEETGTCIDVEVDAITYEKYKAYHTE